MLGHYLDPNVGLEARRMVLEALQAEVCAAATATTQHLGTSRHSFRFYHDVLQRHSIVIQPGHSAKELLLSSFSKLLSS